MSDIFILDFPGRQMRLEYIAADGERSPIALAQLALEALFLFAEDFCEPLSMDLSLVCCDLKTGYPVNHVAPPRPFWLVHKRELPPGVEITPAWENEEVATIEKLDLDSILYWIKTPFQQACNGAAGETLAWNEMLFRAFRLRLPFSEQDLTENTLRVGYGMGVIEHPVERSGSTLWVSGPLTRTTPTAPLEIRINNEVGELTLDLWLLWSPWGDKNEVGYEQVENAVSKLTDGGWKLTIY